MDRGKSQSTPVEPAIGIESREQLLYLLAEAAEIEHNLMCSYLYAAFSLKSSTAEGVSETECDAIQRWRRAIIAVAVGEMAHLALVANLTTALGGAARFSRPNFPVGAGLYPSGVSVKLAPFDRQTLQHFIYLERPEGLEVPDGESFASRKDYERPTVTGKCMPSAQDYLTVGHLYRALASGIAAMVARCGETATFIGDPSAQIGREIVALPGLCVVTDLRSATAAIQTIVEQGEGAQSASPESHYGRFVSVATEYDQLSSSRSDFVPHRSVARNPVMRKPPDAGDKVFVDLPEAAKLLDLGNAVYGQMLRCLAQAFGRSGTNDAKRLLVDSAIELMSSLSSVAEFLTTLPASVLHPGVTAGISFAMLRDVTTLPRGSGEWALLCERFGELTGTAQQLSDLGTPIAKTAAELASLQERFIRRAAAIVATSGAAASDPSPATKHDEARPAPQSTLSEGIEVVSGSALTLRFQAKRCIHARFCVLGLPGVYKANVEGPWIDPDAASIEANVAVAHNCPSGAIQYERHDGGPQESGPSVNVVGVRENGPYAFRAPLSIDGAGIGYRATLCRCGASKNKPFCDGSHSAIGFQATGEPAAGVFESLAVRSGALEISPQRNGPLAISGNLEILSGTGRTIMKTTHTVLCRCGHSQRKPYCDGSHARAGFVA